MNIKENDKIVIIGGGFAGIQLIKSLKRVPVQITLIDKQNFHSFQPLLYQVASARIEPASISFPFRKIFQSHKNFDFLMANVKEIDTKSKIVKTDAGEVPYDHLVIASGCSSNFFGNKELMEHALPMKEMRDAIIIRNKILQDFEKQSTASNDEREEIMNLVIVGAGATGVELAGAFAELKNDVLPKDYPKLDFSNFKIFLLEGGPYTLANMSDVSRKYSRKQLENLGVEVKTNVLLQSYNGKEAILSNGEKIACKNLIWSAGVSGNIIKGVTEDKYIVRNRYKVNRRNRLENCDTVYALGDVAYMETKLYPKGHPQVANVAINQAKNFAENIKRSLKEKAGKDYEYRDLGMMATIGKNKAVVELPFIKFQGFLAWLSWMFLHLMLILTVRNKLIIFINWAWAYISKDTSLRLIIRTDQISDKKTAE